MELSVIIPTHNRAQRLLATLHALEQQPATDGRAFDYEVIVVDDGSTDSTQETLSQFSKDSPVPLRVLHQQNLKQGTARNYGAREALGKLLLFLGDDTEPSPQLLAQHLRSHREVEEERKVVIGYTPWAHSLKVTRFMKFVGEQGWQFGFSLIGDPENVPFNFFYTSNISLHRSFFLGSGGFDESFQEYGWEDIELSWRLREQGMRLVFNREAVAYHDHPTTIRSFMRRQRQVGRSAWVFYRRHPELAHFLGIQDLRPYTLWERLRLDLLTGLCRLTEFNNHPDLSRYYPDILTYHYKLGLLESHP